MPDLQTIAVFSGAIILLLLSPGPNMAFALSHAMAYGWRGALAVALGIALADSLLTLLTATGVSGLVAAWPPSFDIIRYCGAAYLLWMAYKTLRSGSLTQGTARQGVSMKAVFWHATLNSLLNPKALLFFIVFLPQFVKPEAGSIAQQLLILGLWLTFLALIFHVLLGVFAHSLGRLFSANGRFPMLQSGLLAGVLTLLAVRLMVMSRP
ncbi:Threonine/homoserine/homoserine lactone efflux protein [Pseudomonas asturiensis]|uniref:Threonine/homoserine/homoserine lactone efflux protein n=1 Tax=Pseudomonas asturiensis TaxID=1190415 RepID=A0A1M7JFG9_9PSED|nr:LysE family translocator [Pseudomonas asturiensis]SHM51621.1 Threonine/homoserine/homoserine lactone efflux protein [Pseudomonas asturiensis]